MDFDKIFLKEACPTSMGGQAIIEGIMMRGAKGIAVAIRMADGSIRLKTQRTKEPSAIAKIPILRGIFAFGTALVSGTKILMEGAEILENYENEHAEELEKLRLEVLEEEKARENNTESREETREKKKRIYGNFQAGSYEKDKVSIWMEEKFGKQVAWNMMIYFSVIVALLFTVGVFIIAPTAIVNGFKVLTENHIALNLIEGIVRIIMFIVYIWAISRMTEIKRVFQFHGAEHKVIHCFENNLALTPENSQQFYTLHPRCGTSFLMFVMVVSLVLFSLLGWPNLLWRIGSRILLIPVVAGLSYELLKWAGKSNSAFVKILSMPGLYLQKLTTKEPEEEHLEISIIAMKAVIFDDERKAELDICLPNYDAFTDEVFKGEKIEREIVD